MSTKKERMYARIENHAENLQRIFPNSEKKGVALCKALFCMENKAHRIAEDYCNGFIGSEEKQNNLYIILEKVKKTLGVDVGACTFILINSDPRGYALKLSDDYMRSTGAILHRSMGGYGILAPDLTND